MKINRTLSQSKPACIDSSYERQEKPVNLKGTQNISVWHSSVVKDNAWDTFLQSIDLGEFEQSSFWAEVKATDGWKCSRILLTKDAKMRLP